MILRELVSRFSFETDKKSVNEYDRNISQMIGKAKKVGGVLGVAFSLKKIGDLSIGTAQAKHNMEQFAGTNLGYLESQLETMESRVESIKSGASAVITTDQKRVLAAEHMNTFGNSKESIDTFTQLLESSMYKAANRGENVSDIFSGLQSAIKTGDLSSLTEFKGIDHRKTKFAEALLDIRDPGEPGGQVRQELSRQSVLELLQSVKSGQQEELRNINDTLLIGRTTKNQAEDFAKGALEKGVTTTEGFLDYLKSDGVKQTAESIFSAISDFGGNAKETHSEFTRAFESWRDKNTGSSNGQDSIGSTNNSAGPVKIEVHSTVNVNGNFDDGEKIGKIVAQKLQDEVKNAERQIIPSEDR